MKHLYRNLLVTSFLLALPATSFAIFLPFYFDELGLSYVQIGVAMGILSITAALLSLYVGYLEEKMDKIKLLLSSYFGYAILPIFYLLAGNFMSVLMVRLYDGVLSSLRVVPTYSLLESKKAYETGVNVSLNEAVGNLGSVLGPLSAGIFILYFGIESLFFMSFLVFFIVALFGLKLLKYSKIKFNKKTKFSSLMNKEFRNKSLMAISLLFLLFTIIDASKFLAITLYMKSTGFNELFIGIIGGSFFFFTFLFELFSGYIETDNIRNKLLTVGLFLCALSVFMFAVLPANFHYLLFLSLVFSLGTALIRPAIFSDLVVYDHSHPNMATGVLIFFSYVGAMIGYILSGVLVEISFEFFFMFGGAVLLISSAISLYSLIREVKPSPQPIKT